MYVKIVGEKVILNSISGKQTLYMYRQMFTKHTYNNGYKSVVIKRKRQ